jgi:outer membrane protein OmpA-like peptidoglycan-associated protein
MTAKRLYNLEVYMNKLIGNSIEVRFGVNYNFIFKQPTVLAGVLLNLPSLRSNTSGTFDPQRSSIMQSVQSTLAFDSFQKELLLTNSGFQSSVGMGAVTVRFFLDENEDGKYTDGENFLPDVVFNIPGIVISQGQDKTESRVHNLMPYAKYNLVINMESFKNPLWTPIANEFSFIADPNTYKPIDVPCYSAGIIEGGVMRGYGKDKRGQAGVKIQIMKVDSTWKQEVSVFADGNFYFMGVPPGDYYATVDSTQMSILNVNSEPKSLPFTVRKTSSGDMVSNINFTLNSNSPGVQPVEKDESKKVIAASIVKPEESTIDKAGNYLEKLIPKDTNQIVDSKNIPIEDKIISSKEMEPKIDGNIKMENSFTFKTSKMTYLTVPMQKELDKIADYLLKNSNARLMIDGHSDNFGSPAENLAVSNTRANEVVNYLIRKGIKKDRLLSAGHGALKAIADNLTDAGRAKNRRVELKVIDKK